MLLEDYHVLDATEELTPWRQTGTPETAQAPQWMRHKTLPSLPMTDLFFGERIEIENAKYIKIGGCVADITRLTALADSDQINSLTWLLENLLGEKETEQTELRDRCQAAAGSLLSDTFDTVLASRTHQYELWLEEVRGLDLLMAACRLRGC